jgi:hypothetical protein
MKRAPLLYPIERLELRFVPKPWAFAVERRADIDGYFARLRREKPAIWNGRVLLLHSQEIADGIFRGDYLETDYASFTAWVHWGRPEALVHDCFGAAAVLSSDGAFVLGRMAPHTFNAGRIYFPSGTPDPADIAGGKVDLEFSVRRDNGADQAVALEPKCRGLAGPHGRSSGPRGASRTIGNLHRARACRFFRRHAELRHGLSGAMV